MARERGFEELAEILVPKNVNNIDELVLSNLERQLHQFMREKASNLVCIPPPLAVSRFR